MILLSWWNYTQLCFYWTDKSDLTNKMKRSFFQAAVVSILLYGCTTWTLTKRLRKKLDGNYARMLRAILNKSCRQLLEKHGRTHQWCTPMDPAYSQAKAGWPARTYIQQLCEDTGCNPEDLPKAMNDREKWRERVRDIMLVTRHDDDDDDIYIYIYIYIYIG